MKYFGTDGFRGEANVTLNVEHAYKVGRFLGNYFQKEDHKVRVVIGKDTRLSGYMFETALASGLTASGADVYELHVTTTPSVSYLVRKENFDCGIMISASHNPYFDNGIKVINGKGHKLEPEIEEQIEKYIDGESEEIPMAKREAIGRCFDYTKGRDEYIEYLKDLVKEPFDGKTVALDLANGSASMIAKEIFESMGAQVIARHDEPNGTNINRECGSTHIEVLQALVYDTGADIGFAYDGDADRCLVVDEKGEALDGDQMMLICALELMKKKQLKDNVLVTTVMSNVGLHQAMKKYGGSCVKTAVGDRYVLEEMLKNGYSLGGEQSGHIIFSRFAKTGDGILTAVQLLGALVQNNKRLSEMGAMMTKYPQILLNVRVADKHGWEEKESIKNIIKKYQEELGDNGQILVRASGTEPLIRIMAEGPQQERLEEIASAIAEVVNSELG